MDERIDILAHKVDDAGGDLWITGGWVRDRLMNRTPKDIDLLITGLDMDTAVRIMVGVDPKTKRVVHEAPVWLCFGNEVALGRREISTGGGGNADFDFIVDKTITIHEELLRRDLTFNSMAVHVLTGMLVDPFDGRKAIADKVCRAVSNHFVEANQRVLRLAVDSCRLDFDVEKRTIGLCRTMSFTRPVIATNQLWMHISKGLAQAVRPSRMLAVLRDADWLFSHLKGLQTPQEPEWHPEGDVLTHTMHVMDEMMELIDDNDNKLVLLLAALVHDMGKASTTIVEDGRIKSPGHAHAPEAEEFLRFIGTPNSIREHVLALVREHMAHMGATVSARFVRRLAQRLGKGGATIREWSLLCMADANGRPPLPKRVHQPVKWVLEIAEELAVLDAQPQPIVTGQHLIDRLGVKVGKRGNPIMGKVLKACFNAQLDGEFTTLSQGLAMAQALLEAHGGAK